MAFSIAPSVLTSQGRIVINLGSGTATVAIWLSGRVLPYASTRIRSSKAGLARPVRMPIRSERRDATAFSIRSSVSSSISSITVLPLDHMLALMATCAK